MFSTFNAKLSIKYVRYYIIDPLKTGCPRLNKIMKKEVNTILTYIVCDLRETVLNDAHNRIISFFFYFILEYLISYVGTYNKCDIMHLNVLCPPTQVIVTFKFFTVFFSSQFD